MVPDSYSKPAAEKSRISLKIWSRQLLRAELLVAEKLVEMQQSPLVVCHNDLLLANFLHDEKNEKVTIIDYEYLAPNPAAFDLANHFNEYAGTEDVDFSNVPDEKYKKWWINQYLTQFYSRDPTEEENKKWHSAVTQMEPLSHLFWGIWALMQAEISEIEFDYVTYAHLRISEYFKLKNELICLKK